MSGVTAAEPVTTEEAAALLEPFRKVKRFVLAVSGGPDSTAMMGLAAEVRAAQGRGDDVAVTVNHGLRPEAVQEAVEVSSLAAGMGLSHFIMPWRGEKPRTGVQEAAREARYEILFDMARSTGSEAIMLAHTLDDQAETVLMRLFRGSGVAGLGGMQVRTKRKGLILARPLLGVRKARLVATCKARGWPYANDPSNRDEKFLRPRLRRLMPLLAEEGLTVERLAILARRMEGAEASIRAAAIGLLDLGAERARKNRERHGAMDAGVFADSPFETAVRMVQQLIHQTQPDALVGPGLEKIESLTGRLRAAISENRPFDGTLGMTKISYKQGYVRAFIAPPRRSP